jgi:ribosome recycling factor
MNPDILEKTKQHLHKILDVIQNDMSTIRTGRATPSLVENVTVPVYGGTTYLKILELAQIGTTDSQTIIITPFDNSIIHEIAKGIEAANMGINPVVDGQIIRIVIPQLSQERRQELIKLMHHKLENGKIMVRQARQEALKDAERLKENEGLSDDELHRIEDEIQKAIDETNATIDAMGKQKEADLMQI